MSDSEQMEVIRLNVRISDLEESVLFWKKDAIAGTTRIRELEARIRELEAALLQYGYHDVTCHYLRETLMCTCGFESLRAALAPKEPS